jgi:prepilin-type processing-associated H-X9-DG protein
MNKQRIQLRAVSSNIVIAIVCTVLLLMNLGSFGNAARERAKRAVCLANLSRLTMAWHAFADDHNGNIVNGAAGINRPGETAWVQECWYDNYGGPPPSYDWQAAAIRSGALWAYCRDLHLYKCPAGYGKQALGYAIVDSMNGYPQPNDTKGRGPVAKLIVKNIRGLRNAANRIVFIDQGWVTADSYAVHYDLGCWWDTPPVIHNAGVTLSFADGHTEHWKWKGRDTIEFGLRNPPVYGGSPCPTTLDGVRDLVRVQIGVWTELGYNPPVW